MKLNEQEEACSFNIISIAVFVLSYLIFNLVNKINNKKEKNEKLKNEKKNIVKELKEPKQVKKEIFKENTLKLEEDSKFFYSKQIKLYSENGDLYRTLNYFERMNKDNIKPDIEIYEDLIKLFIKKNKLVQALAIINDIQLNKFKMQKEVYSLLLKSLHQSENISNKESKLKELLKLKDLILIIDNKAMEEDLNQDKVVSDCSTSTYSFNSPRNSLLRA